ncbi:lysozyme [bacterium]|nr:lysozyme [bacterium]
MNVSENGLNLIKTFEGCRLTAYKCPAGVWTIGYGHTGSDVKQGLKISRERADSLLKQDVLVHSNNVSRLVKVPLTQNQFDALVSFEYNVGYANFSKSTMLRLLNQRQYLAAANQFDRWIYANRKVLSGLVKRRKAEKTLFLRQ